MQVKQRASRVLLNNSWIVLLLLFSQLTSCATYPWPKNDRSGTAEQRVEAANMQFNQDLDNTNKRKKLRLEKEAATDEMLSLADKARVSGDYQQAINYYDKLLEIDPSNGQAEQLKLAVLKDQVRSEKMIQAETLYHQRQYKSSSELVREILIEKPDYQEAINLLKKIKDESHQTKIKLPELKANTDKPITLELREVNIKVVFEALSRATGINFILDKDIKPDVRTTIFIRKMSVEDAIDMVLASNGLGKKILSENSVLVYPNTAPKIKDYQDLTIRSFYLTNANAKQVATMLKTMLKTKDIYVDERLNMLVMRDTPDIVRIAEKLVQANDMADPEVMLDIEVLEVSRSRLQELGITYPNQLSVLSANTGLTLEALRNITAANVGVRPNPSVNFNKTVGDVNLLSNPRIRVKNNEKAKVLVGDKVPIITTTSTANVGVAENVTYVDVGLKLDVEPRINLDNYVNIKVGLEVSSLGEKTITKNGAEVYTIGTRNANTMLRLKNGETQILAGLILDDERKTATRLPGFGDLPLLGRLFGNQTDKKSKTEIVLAITPRILSNIQLPESEVSEYWSGSETLMLDRPKISLPATGSSSSPASATVTKTNLDAEFVKSTNEVKEIQNLNPEEASSTDKGTTNTAGNIPQANLNSGAQPKTEEPSSANVQSPNITSNNSDNNLVPPANSNVSQGDGSNSIERGRKIIEEYRNATKATAQ